MADIVLMHHDNLRRQRVKRLSAAELAGRAAAAEHSPRGIFRTRIERRVDTHGHQAFTDRMDHIPRWLLPRELR
jgi:hypothetical protein